MKTKTLISIFLLFAFIHCDKDYSPIENNPSENPVISADPKPANNPFPNLFLESGYDSNYTYFSIKTEHDSNYCLVIKTTGWGIEEYGLFLQERKKDSTMILKIQGMCGTVFSYTWIKVSFETILYPESEDSLSTILFSHYPDTLMIRKE